MFTVELKINGTMIGHIYGKNKGLASEGTGETIYEYEYYEPDGGDIARGFVLHKREDGLRHLVRLVLEDI